MDEILTKVAKVRELLPKLKDPTRIAKAEAFLQAHGQGKPKSGFIGTGTGNQQEGLAGIEDKLPTEKVTAVMPEQPSLAGEVASSLGSAALGFDNAAFAGIPHRAIARSADVDAAEKAAELTGGDTLAPYTRPPASTPGFETASDMADRVEAQDPLSSAAGAISSLSVGGLPMLFDKAASRILTAVGMKAAPKSAIIANAVRRGITSSAAGLASGATTDAVTALDQANRHPEKDRGPVEDRLTSEAEKLAIQAMISGGVGSLAGAMGARAAATRDPMTTAGAGGLAQKVVRLEEAGGGIGPTGVKIPESLKPVYAAAMSGGEKIPRVGEADVVPAGATPELAEIFKARPAEVTQPALSVKETVTGRALPLLQSGIAKADRYTGSTAQQMNDAFYATETAKNARVIPNNLAKKAMEFIKIRTFKDQSPIAYTNSGEPIRELNKMFTVGDAVSSAEAADAIRRNPNSVRMTVPEARASGFNIPDNAPDMIEGKTPWVVLEPKPMNVQQYEEMVDGVQAAAKVANVKGDPDKMHAEFLRAAMEDRKQVPWPAELGSEPVIHRALPGDKGSRTITGWAAVQLKKHELLKELETDLFNLGTDRAQATNATTGAAALRNSLGNLGEPGTGLAERAASKHMVNEPGGREALNNILATNYIEGNGGIRNAMELSNPWFPFRQHDRRALMLALDPLLVAAGKSPTVAGAVAPGAEAIQPYLQQLLQGISARMGR